MKWMIDCIIWLMTTVSVDSSGRFSITCYKSESAKLNKPPLSITLPPSNMLGINTPPPPQGLYRGFSVLLTDFFDMVLQLISSLAINYQYLFFSLYSKYCKTWYQLLVAKLLYCNPAVKSFDLQYHTQVCNWYWLNDWEGVSVLGISEWMNERTNEKTNKWMQERTN